jgi:ABC-type sugar transport system ATPase subunit
MREREDLSPACGLPTSIGSALREVLALVGGNGAGKSTLIKILGGAVPSDAGSIEVAGCPVQLRGPTAARRAGISIIYQEFNLVPALTARENIFLGQERSRFSWLPISQEHRRSRDLLERIGVTIAPETPCRDLTVAQQQVIEIAKGACPASAGRGDGRTQLRCSPRETEALFAVIRELQSQGIGLILHQPPPERGR